MNSVLAFWQFLNYVVNLSPPHTCSVLAGAGIPDSGNVPAHVVYGGNCGQAFVMALADKLAWVVNP
jgi:hypothetical protein